MVARASAALQSGEVSDAPPRAISPELQERRARFTYEREQAHAQDWDLGLDLAGDLDLEKEREKQVCPAPPIPVRIPDAAVSRIGLQQFESRSDEAASCERDSPEGKPEELLEIYEAERGELPAAGAMTPERRRQCERWLAAGFTTEQFGAAVRCAAATPFLAGDGSRGWQASFDWLTANRSNVQKVLEGEYAPQGRARARKARPRDERPGPADLHTGLGPRPVDCGVRVNPAALARIRPREAQRAGNYGRTAERGVIAPQTGEPTADRVPDLAPDLAPKPVAFDAQPRAAPAVR